MSAISRSGHIDVACPRCGASFSAEVWLLVDVWERPDLAARLQQGILHIALCPQCDGRVAVDTPLLVFRAYKDPPILLSMPRTVSEEEARASGVSLLIQLRDALGDQWRPEWLEQQYETVDREEVRILLNTDLALVGRQMMTTEGAEKALDAGEAPELLQALWDLLSCDSWATTRDVLAAHPSLLEEEVVETLHEFLCIARLEHDQELIEALDEHIRLLERCRQVGVDAALAEGETDLTAS